MPAVSDYLTLSEFPADAIVPALTGVSFVVDFPSSAGTSTFVGILDLAGVPKIFMESLLLLALSLASLLWLLFCTVPLLLLASLLLLTSLIV